MPRGPDLRKGDRHLPSEKRRQDRHKGPRNRKSKAKPFLAVDGEGWGTDGTTVEYEPAQLKAMWRIGLRKAAEAAEDIYTEALFSDRPSLEETGGRLKEPPPRVKIEERFGGGWNHQSGEYDWFWELHPLEQSRIRGSWFGSSLTPDEVEDMGLPMSEWLNLTRRIDAARTIQDGKRVRPKAWGGRNPLANLANELDEPIRRTPGRQHYQQMTAANDSEHYRLDMGRPLHTHECLSFLYGLPSDRVLISFSFGYDVAMILRDLPPDKLAELHDRAARTDEKTGKTRCVYWEGWLLDWLPRKQFKLGRMNQTTRKIGWRIISDCFGFFGKGFASVLEEWPVVTPDEKAAILEGKARRQTDNHDRHTEAEYSRLECIALARIMDQIKHLCAQVGYPLTSYYGGGSIAGAMLKTWGTKHHTSAPTDEKDPRPDTLPAAMRVPVATAYMGGRFETAIYGEIPSAHVYDIRSAYPSVMRDLPCLAHGHWARTRSKSVRDADLWRVSWSADVPPAWGPLGVRRSDGRISFPGTGEGWYWGSEVRAALNYWTRPDQTITLHQGWRWHQECDHLPFSRVEEVYNERAARKAAGDPAAQVLKIGINSLYGKTAQAVGVGAYHDYCWAGMITAATRAKLLDAIAQNPARIVGTATDSVTSLEPLDLPESDRLGDWEAKEVRDVLVVQNGVQSQLSGEGARTRGMSRSEVPWDRLRAEWRTRRFEGRIELSRTRFCGLAVAIQRNKPELMGRWLNETYILTFGDPIKRLNALFPDGGMWPTLAATGTPDQKSHPYKRLLPRELQAELAYQLDDG